MEQPDYIKKLAPGFPNKCEAELELMLAASWNLRQHTGHAANFHRRRGLELLYPSRKWHDWRLERLESVQFCLENGIQELMWIGAASSGKSVDMADIPLALWWTNPANTTIYVASPYESATEDNIWAYFQEQFNEAKENNPTLPGRIKTSENSIVLYDKAPRAFIRVATVDQVGKLVGKKARGTDTGLLIIILDELPAFTAAAARALLGVLPNLISNKNLLIIGAGNFAWVGDALGTLCDPDERDIPGGYSGFDPDLHHRWRTKRSGLVLRFDGLQSPNVKAGKDIYPFVTTNEYIAKFVGSPGGLQSPEAMRYVRSAPITNLNEFTVTNGERLRAGGCYDSFDWTDDPITLMAFTDPGFGTDPCVLQKFKTGWQRIPSGGRRQVIALWEEPFIIPIKLNLKDAGGKPVPIADQIALEAKAHCRKKLIPDQNSGFDGSLRADIVQAFGRLYSPLCPAIDSQGSATNRPSSNAERERGKEGALVAIPWSKKVDRLLSEMWFATASLADTFQLKNLNLSPKAVDQLTTRVWSPTGNKKKRLSTKEEHKEMLRLQGKPVESPNEADAVVGGVEMARRMGFELDILTPGGGALQQFLDMIRDKSLGKAKSFAVNKGAIALPSGRLHAMTQSKRPARLARTNR